jgi:hypothetical protein
MRKNKGKTEQYVMVVIKALALKFRLLSITFMF